MIHHTMYCGQIDSNCPNTSLSTSKNSPRVMMVVCLCESCPMSAQSRVATSKVAINSHHDLRVVLRRRRAKRCA